MSCPIYLRRRKSLFLDFTIVRSLFLKQEQYFYIMGNRRENIWHGAYYIKLKSADNI